MAELIACRDCGADVPYGRLTCPECGGLLASVSGATHHRDGSGSQDESASADAQTFDGQAQADDQPLDPDDAPLDLGTSAPGLHDTAFDLEDGLPFHNDPSPQADPFPDAVVDWPLAATEPVAGPEPDARPEPADQRAVAAGPGVAADQSVGVASFATTGAADLSNGADVDARELPWLDRPAAAPEHVEPSWTSTPGAYVPPVMPTVAASGPTGVAAMSGGVGAAPARAWGSASASVAGAYAPPSQQVTGDSRAASDTGPADPDETTDRRAVGPAKAGEFVGWLAIAGAALALAGFVLPWSTSVIGAAGVGYLDRWGLAGPGHLLLAIAIAGVLVAAVLRDRVPLWLGVGLPGLGLGALVIGLAWPYVIGPLGGQLGVIAVAIGSVLLVAAGILAIVLEQQRRHARDEPSV